MFDNLKRVATKIAGKVPLRTIIIVPFVLQIVGTVGLVGYLSFKNGQQAVEDLAYQLIDQVGDQVEQNLRHYLDVPQKINESRAASIRTGILNWKDFSVQESYFAELLKIYPTVSSIAIATENKEFLAVERLLKTDSLVIRIQNQSTNKTFHYYAADRQGKRQKITKIRKDFNPHNDPPNGKAWYKAVKQANRTIWLPVVALSQGVDNPILMIVNFLPFKDRDGTFQGVLASTVSVPQFASFLRNLKIGQTGQTFVIDRKGLLIASSTGEMALKQDLDANYRRNLNPQDWRLEARNSKNTLTQKSVNFLSSQVSNLNQITQKQKFAFKHHQNRHFLRVTPMQKDSGLDWIIVTVVPESDFMAEIYNNTYITVFLCTTTLCVATGIGFLTARWIIKPILYLNTAAEKIAQGEWDKIVELHRIDEVGKLAKSFNSMATQIKQSFVALKESENRLNQFLEALPMGVVVHDHTGQLSFANLAAKQLLNIETLPDATTEQLAVAYQVYRSETDQLYPVEEMPSMRALSGESCTADDLELRQSDGVISLEVWATPVYNDTCQIVLAIAAFTNITQRKQTQKILDDYSETLEHQIIKRTTELVYTNEQLQQEIGERQRIEAEIIRSKELFESVFNESADAIFLVNSETLLTIDCNQSAVQLFEAQSKDELINVNGGSILQKEAFTKEEVHSIVNEIALYGFWSRELEFVTKKRKVFWGNIAAKEIHVAGQIMHLVRVTDITTRKQAEAALQENVVTLKLSLEQLKQTQAQLVQAEKMSSLGQMIAGIAHEINNPVSFIYGNLTPARQYHQDLLSLVEVYQQTYPNPTAQIQQLVKEIDLDFVIEDWSKLMDSMQVGAERISEIVRNLRNFSRLDEKELKSVDIHQGIDNTLLILQHHLKAKASKPEIQVIKDYGKLPPVTCYANQLNQVFMNLLNNAIDALENKSSLRIITIRTTLVLGKEPQTNSVMIRITDNGCGISESVINQVFDPFFTTKPIGSGTGLGLAISYQIVVDKHKGQIRCVSDVAQGTEFIVEIPVKPLSRLGINQLAK